MIRLLSSDVSEYRDRLVVLSACALVAMVAAFGLLARPALATAAYPACSTTQHASCLFGPSGTGGFEIDGNRTVDSSVDSSNGIDWNTVPFPMALTHFTDASKSTSDDSFKSGSFRNVQTTWTCAAHKNDGKDDIKNGNIAIRTVNGQQYLYLDFSRVAGPGTTFIEYNFSQAAQNLTTNQGCNALPLRQTGDLSIEFGFTDGGFAKSFAVEKWTCAPGCTFADASLGAEGVNWEMAFNDSEDNKATYGEAAVDLTAIEGLGTISCDHFSKVWMDSHASEKEKNEMKDLVAAQPFNGGCAVAPVNPTIATQASQPVTVGGSISDTATLSGGVNPTGTITFDVFGPNDATCAGDPAFTSTATAPVTGNGNYSSASFVATAAGTYRFVATYSGDANNNPAFGHCNDANESVVVSPAPVVVLPGGGGNAGTGTTTAPVVASGAAPAAISLPRAGAGPQQQDNSAGGAFGAAGTIGTLLLALTGGALFALRRRQGPVAAE